MNSTTLIGNLTDNPELRYTSDGTAVASMTLAVNRRVVRDGEPTDQLDGFFDVTAFGSLGEHAAETLAKGGRTVVTGRLQQDRWEDKNGTRRTAVKVVAEEVAPALRFATADVSKTAKAAAEADGEAGV